MPEESPVAIVRMKNTESRKALETAENSGILRTFYGAHPTGPNGVDCYTFERFAPTSGDIHTYYYYLYKK